MDYKLKPEETLDSYKIRLCKNKDLYDLRWQDISELWFEETAEKKSPDWFRKFWRFYSEGYEAATKNNAGLTEQIQELEDKTIEFEQMKIRYADRKRDYFNPNRIEARMKEYIDVALNEVKKLNYTKPLSWERKEFLNDSDREGLLVISDTHYGLFANNYWNDFNNEEFKRRMIRLVNKTIEHGKTNNIKVLNVFLLGDLINGLIHLITRISNTVDAVTQTIQVSEILSEVLNQLANKFEQIKVFNVRGNHDRVTPNKKDEIAKESFNDFIPEFLKLRLINAKNISFCENQFDDEIIVTDILGYKIFGVHGHKDKVTNVNHNLSQMTKSFADYIIMGHTHHHEENEDHGVEIIVNRSFSGVDDYAKDIRRTSKPAQMFIVFDREEGRLASYDIKF
jgi:predicted phosphodiesterase